MKVKTPYLSDLVSAFDWGIWMNPGQNLCRVNLEINSDRIFYLLWSLAWLPISFKAHAQSSMTWSPLAVSFNPDASHSLLISPSTILPGTFAFIVPSAWKTPPQTFPRLIPSPAFCSNSNFVLIQMQLSKTFPNYPHRSVIPCHWCFFLFFPKKLYLPLLLIYFTCFSYWFAYEFRYFCLFYSAGITSESRIVPR